MQYRTKPLARSVIRVEATMNPDGYIAIGLALLALIFWAFWRLNCAERRRQYALAVEAEALRREILRAQLYQDAMLDRRD